MEFIFEDSEKSTSTPFIDLNHRQRSMVERQFALLLDQSFQADELRAGVEFRQRVQTEAEVKRRGKMLFKWFRIMRCDLGMSAQQAVDLLPAALRTELDGGAYVPPPKNRLWTPTNGALI
jgi:hypothetical protein